MKTIREEFLKKARANLTKYYRGELGLRDWEKRVEARIGEESGMSLDIVKKLEKHTGPIKGKKILSVGSGWRGLVVAAAKMGAKAFGLEPDREKVEISKLRASLHGIKADFYVAKGEVMPFKNNTFDVVECSSVLEHVDDPKKVIEEMIRVLKPGGICYINAPNYLYPVERHYKTIWIPLMPKPFAKLQLRLLGRNPKFIEHINYITPYFFDKTLREFGKAIDVTNISGLPRLNTKEGKSFGGRIKRILWNCIVAAYDRINVGYSPIELLIKKSHR